MPKWVIDLTVVRQETESFIQEAETLEEAIALVLQNDVNDSYEQKLIDKRITLVKEFKTPIYKGAE